MIKSLGHIVLTSQNIEQTTLFYRDVLGMQLETFSQPDGGQERKALKFGNQKSTFTMRRHHMFRMLKTQSQGQSIYVS